MARVQMLLSITGGRPDGSEWPLAGQFLDCGDDEAASLVRGNMARWPADGAESAPDGAAGAPAGDETPGGDNGSQDDGDPSKPRVRDEKAAWEMHAVTLGVTPEVAAAMTKADLIAQYGTSPPA
jgi:hypothetical protein